MRTLAKLSLLSLLLLLLLLVLPPTARGARTEPHAVVRRRLEREQRQRPPVVAVLGISDASSKHEAVLTTDEEAKQQQQQHKGAHSPSSSPSTPQPRPLIGILSQPKYWKGMEEAAGGYIAASYVKYVEAAGARAVPIRFDQAMKNHTTLARRRGSKHAHPPAIFPPDTHTHTHTHTRAHKRYCTCYWNKWR